MSNNSTKSNFGAKGWLMIAVLCLIGIILVSRIDETQIGK